ncbi:MAG: hypothetical protein JXB10_04480 [Pirellulales bacterium]|nr:hypothetical protein [Pirellulales bacterium]
MTKKRRPPNRLAESRQNLPVAQEPRAPDQPVWTPEGVQWSYVPEAIQQAVRDIIEPIYVESVLRAPDGLEKSLAITLTHLLWLEILDQYEIKQEYANTEALLGLPGSRESQIDRHIRLLDSKIRVGKLLYKFRELRHRIPNLPPPTVQSSLPMTPVLPYPLDPPPSPPRESVEP